MEIIGRTTADAQAKVTRDGKEVVNFSIAINNNYKPKGATELKKVVTYVDCSYWLNTGIAQYIKKGTIVQLSGSISARAWNNSQGEPKASLNFHVDAIRLLGSGKKTASINESPTDNQSPSEDLPF